MNMDIYSTIRLFRAARKLTFSVSKDGETGCKDLSLPLSPSGHGDDGWMVGLDDLIGLFQP